VPALTIALSKGRLLDETLPLFARAGVIPVEDPNVSRKLILATSHGAVSLVILRATDVPTYVQYGAADLGVDMNEHIGVVLGAMQGIAKELGFQSS